MNTDRANKLRAEQLGMPYGTANAKLRKAILFKLVQRLNEDICFKCKLKIVSIEELSIEHKQPWFNRNSALFWDLDNIAFSHLKCNVKHSDIPNILRKVGPEGTAWCSDHQVFLPFSEFYSDPVRWNGYNSSCKVHHLARTNARKAIVRSK